jgi:hypothetical protein
LILLVLGWLSGSVWAHPAGDGHISHDTRVVIEAERIRIEHEIVYPRGFLDLDLRDVRLRGGDEPQFRQLRLDEVQGGLAATWDERPVPHEALSAEWGVPLPDGSERISVRWEWANDPAADHTLVFGTANALDEPSMFRTSVISERPPDTLENADGVWRHEPTARRAVVRIARQPEVPDRLVAVAIASLLVAAVFMARRRSIRSIR